MRIDDRLILNYLRKCNTDLIGEHWIFSHIEEGWALLGEVRSNQCEVISGKEYREIGLLVPYGNR